MLWDTTLGSFFCSLFFENGKCYAVSLKPRPFLREGVKAQTCSVKDTLRHLFDRHEELIARTEAQSGA